MSRSTVLALLAGAVLAAHPGRAEAWPADSTGTPLLSDRAGIIAGAFLNQSRTTYVEAGPRSIGTVMVLERDLNLSTDNTNGRSDVFYRIKPRHTLVLTLIAINRSGDRVVDRSLEFRDLSFTTNTSVHTTFDSALMGLGYRYSFINDGRVETGIATGISVYRYDLSLTGQASLTDTTGGGGTQQLRHASSQILAPIPSVGIFSALALRHDLVFYGAMTMFVFHYGSFSANMVDGDVGLHYFPVRHIGVGAAFAGTSVGVSNGTLEQTVGATYAYSGWLLTLDLTM